jgi:hypothetical protein
MKGKQLAHSTNFLNLKSKVTTRLSSQMRLAVRGIASESESGEGEEERRVL